MRIRRTSSHTPATIAVLSLVALAALSACGSNSDDAASSTSSGQSGGSAGLDGGAPEPVREDAPADGVDTGDRAASIPDAGAYQGPGSGSKGSTGSAVLPSESLIKTGSVSLQSDDIGHVLTQVYGIVGGVGGDISKEDTTTDDKGKAVRSTLVLRVPVDEFDSTLNDLSQLGTLVNRVRNSKDVTTEVADIDSRVKSAQRSINTLRQLFDRATRLTDIIRLESELSQREADLESLEAQQRSLNDKTTMSTITMTLELPLVTPKPKPKPDDDEAGGFVSGIQQGWDALRATTLAVGHLVGVVLPLGCVVLVLGALGYWLVRRFSPPSPAPPQDPASV
jgi:hypothetical protein